MTGHPLVSIIVPAYNEEVNAVKSIHNLLKCKYPSFEIIFVDDGSTDATYGKVQSAFSDHPRIKIFTKPNGGKASALNFGIAKSIAGYVVCIDADTKLAPDAVTMLMRNQSLDDFMAEMIELRKELHAIGNNFNQAVHRLHILEKIPEFSSWILMNENDKKKLLNKVEEIKNRINQFAEKW